MESDAVHLDLAATKALAHPVRMRMLGMLRLDGPATASQLALRVGANSGATSYHLRQLAEHGLVQEAPELGNRRDRWWRASHRSTTVHWQSDPAGREAWAAFTQVAIAQQVNSLVRSVESVHDLSDEWAATVTNNDATLLLDHDQAEQVRRRVEVFLRDLVAEFGLSDPQRPVTEQLEPGQVQYTVQAHGFPRAESLPDAETVPVPDPDDPDEPDEPDEPDGAR